jgi:hypothetical protein
LEPGLGGTIKGSHDVSVDVTNREQDGCLGLAPLAFQRVIADVGSVLPFLLELLLLLAPLFLE